jgi:hypothetical protein
LKAPLPRFSRPESLASKRTMNYLVNMLHGLLSHAFSHFIFLSGDGSALTVYNSQTKPKGAYSEICGQGSPPNAGKPGELRVTFNGSMTLLSYPQSGKTPKIGFFKLFKHVLVFCF